VADRPDFGTILGRSLRLRCPRCGGGKLFRSYFRMNAECPQCKLRYERAPGYFLGSMYINYGLTTLLMTVAYVALVFGAGLSNREVLAPLLVFVVLFPVAWFRHARSLWLGMDCYFDRTDFDLDE
jgi:uncharacterized protein (DUF983 family)